MKNYTRRVLIAFDQLVNALCKGYPDETISARAWRLKDQSKFWMVMEMVIDGIFFFDPNHCYESYLAERNRTQLHELYRCNHHR